MDMQKLLNQLEEIKRRTDAVHSVVFEEVEDIVLYELFGSAADDDTAAEPISDAELEALFKG